MNIDYRYLTIGILVFEYGCYKLGQFYQKEIK